MTLDEQLIALADKHGANYISLALYTLAGGKRFFGVSVHASDATASDDLGADGSLQDRLTRALEVLASRRLSIEAPELAALEVEAA